MCREGKGTCAPQALNDGAQVAARQHAAFSQHGHVLPGEWALGRMGE
jgi:hypothetical protein